jgi:ubiquinone/menaquinone biosynthesis C-methylase UbiE
VTDSGSPLDAEAERIRRVFEERSRTIPWQRYSVSDAGVLFMHLQRIRSVVRLLAREGWFPLHETRALDVGCGRGGWLVDFESWGAQQSNLAGIEIEPSRLAQARTRLRDADIRHGDGATLPWADESFDLVIQSTVFTSILDDEMRRGLAREMARVLRPGGAVLWYDFFRDNPRNPHVRAVRSDEIRRLFPGLVCELRRVTLAPPISRRLAPLSWTAALWLEATRLLNTHYLGVLRRVAPPD